MVCRSPRDLHIAPPYFIMQQIPHVAVAAAAMARTLPGRRIVARWAENMVLVGHRAAVRPDLLRPRLHHLLMRQAVLANVRQVLNRPSLTSLTLLVFYAMDTSQCRNWHLACG